MLLHQPAYRRLMQMVANPVMKVEDFRMDVIASINKALDAGSDARAIEYRGRWYDWKALSEYAKSIKALLPATRAGTAVAIVVRNRPAHVAAFLGLIASGHRVVMVYAYQP